MSLASRKPRDPSQEILREIRALRREVQALREDATPERLLSLPEVSAMIGRTKQWITKAEAADRFPRRRKLGEGVQGRVGFLYSEVLRWMRELPAGQMGAIPAEDLA